MKLEVYESFSLEHCFAVFPVSSLRRVRTLALSTMGTDWALRCFAGHPAVALGRLSAFQSRRRHSTSSVNNHSYHFRISAILLLIQSHENYPLNIDPIIRLYYSRRRAPRTTIHSIPPSHLVILQCRQIHRRSYLSPYKYQDHPFLA